jgi:hypothetical protein
LACSMLRSMAGRLPWASSVGVVGSGAFLVEGLKIGLEDGTEVVGRYNLPEVLLISAMGSL